MRDLIAIDPGVKALGWAWFREERLRSCGLLRAKDIQGMVQELNDLDEGLGLDGFGLVVERPQVYVGAKSDPNDLLGLAVVAGASAGVFCLARQIDLPHPATWKGQVPKEIHHTRILGRIDFREAGVFQHGVAKVPRSLQHNVLDAVGLGLWKLGRMG